MNDLFRAIFGIPLRDQHEGRMDDRVPQNYRKNFSGNFGGDDDDDDDYDDDEDNGANMRNGPRGIFGFPLFYDPNEIHKRFTKLVDEMNKAIGVFGFSNGPSITWDDGSGNESSMFRDETEPKSLRDAYLKKPDCMCEKINQKDDINLSVNLKTGNFEPGTSSNSPSIQYSYPKVYSKSVFIQTVRRPDGSVETIKKVRDHEGNEETTISQSHVSDPLPTPPEDQLIPKEDTTGISIFKKFFSF